MSHSIYCISKYFSVLILILLSPRSLCLDCRPVRRRFVSGVLAAAVPSLISAVLKPISDLQFGHFQAPRQ